MVKTAAEMYAIDYITDFNERYGNLDFKTYNRNSVACNTLETLTDEQRDVIFDLYKLMKDNK